MLMMCPHCNKISFTVNWVSIGNECDAVFKCECGALIKFKYSDRYRIARTLGGDNIYKQMQHIEDFCNFLRQSERDNCPLLPLDFGYMCFEYCYPGRICLMADTRCVVSWDSVEEAMQKYHGFLEKKEV